MASFVTIILHKEMGELPKKGGFREKVKRKENLSRENPPERKINSF